jgi:hypothetical protein
MKNNWMQKKYILNMNDFWDSSFAIWKVITEKEYLSTKKDIEDIPAEDNKIVTSEKGNEFLIHWGGDCGIYRKAPLSHWGQVDQCIWLLDNVDSNLNDDNIVYAVVDDLKGFTSILDITKELSFGFKETELCTYKPYLREYILSQNWTYKEDLGVAQFSNLLGFGKQKIKSEFVLSLFNEKEFNGTHDNEAFTGLTTDFSGKIFVSYEDQDLCNKMYEEHKKNLD